MTKEEAWLVWMNAAKTTDTPIETDFEVIKKTSWWAAFSAGWDAAAVNVNGWDNAYMMGLKNGKEIETKYKFLFHPIDKEEIIFWSIEKLELDVRSMNCLQSQGIHTIGDLCSQHTYDLKKIPNLGKATLKNIIEALAEHGLKLRT